MAVGILISPWVVRPSLGYGIDWGNPLSSGLVEAVMFNEYGGSPYSLLRHVAAAQVGTGQTWVNQARSYDRSGGRDQLPDNSAFQITTALSVACGLISTVALADTSWCQGPNRRASANPAGGEFGFNFNNGNNAGAGQKQFYWINSGSFQSVTTNTLVALNTPEHWMGTRTAAGTAGKFYVNGVQKASTTGLSVPISSTSVINFGAIGDGTEPWGGSMLYFYLWNRELSAAEAAAVYANPYQLIAPRRTYYNAAAVASGGGLLLMGCGT